jgi:DNA-binding transcriptional regulator GbsR (MarR family)
MYRSSENVYKTFIKHLQKFRKLLQDVQKTFTERSKKRLQNVQRNVYRTFKKTFTERSKKRLQNAQKNVYRTLKKCSNYRTFTERSKNVYKTSKTCSENVNKTFSKSWQTIWKRWQNISNITTLITLGTLVSPLEYMRLERFISEL